MALSGSFSGGVLNDKYKLRVDWSATQSVANNTSTITCAMYLVQASGYRLFVSSRSGNTTVINGTSYSWTAAAVNGGAGSTTKFATVTSGAIAHNADGTKSITITATYYIKATLSGTYYEKITASATITLDTIPRATQPILSASSADMGTDVTISTPRASSSFTHDLAYSFAGGSWVSIAPGVATSYSWTVPDLATSIPNTTSGTMTIRCITKNGSTTIGTKTVLLTAKVPTSVVPTVSSVSVAETVSGLAAQFGAFVQGKSAIKATISASGAKGSTIKAYSSTFLGKSYTSSSWTSDTLADDGTLTITTKVQDSRGRWSSPKYTTVTVLPYSAPQTKELTVYRCDSNGNAKDDGAYMSVSWSYGVATVGNKNTASMRIDYKRTTETSYSSSPLVSSTELEGSGLMLITSTTFSADYQYDVRMTVTDWFGASATYVTTLPTAKVIMDIGADGLGVAFGKTSEKDAFEVSMKAEFGDQVGFVKEMTCLSPAKLSGGQWVHTAAGNVGTRSFIKFVEITVLNIYVNTGISFDIIHRGDPYPSRVNIQFENVGNTDPNVVAFTVYGSNNGVWIKKETTSTWGIYVYMNDAYDRIDVVGFAFPAYMQYGVSVNFVDVAADNVDGATQATIGTMKVNASNAISADSAKFADFLTGFVSRPSDQTWGVQTGTYVSGMNDSTGGSVAWRRDCPSGGQLSMVIDGLVYVAEGAQRVLHTGDVYGNFERRSDGSAGGYIKIGDYQICFGWLYFNIAVSTATGNSYYGVWEGTHNYARAFGDTPAVTLTVNSDLIKSTSLITSNATGFRKVQLFDSRSRTAQGWYVYYVAVGKA